MGRAPEKKRKEKEKYQRWQEYFYRYCQIAKNEDTLGPKKYSPHDAGDSV